MEGRLKSTGKCLEPYPKPIDKPIACGMTPRKSSLAIESGAPQHQWLQIVYSGFPNLPRTSVFNAVGS